MVTPPAHKRCDLQLWDQTAIVRTGAVGSSGGPAPHMGLVRLTEKEARFNVGEGRWADGRRKARRLVDTPHSEPGVLLAGVEHLWGSLGHQRSWMSA